MATPRGEDRRQRKKGRRRGRERTEEILGGRTHVVHELAGNDAVGQETTSSKRSAIRLSPSSANSFPSFVGSSLFTPSIQRGREHGEEYILSVRDGRHG